MKKIVFLLIAAAAITLYGSIAVSAQTERRIMNPGVIPFDFVTYEDEPETFRMYFKRSIIEGSDGFSLKGDTVRRSGDSQLLTSLLELKVQLLFCALSIDDAVVTVRFCGETPRSDYAGRVQLLAELIGKNLGFEVAVSEQHLQRQPDPLR